MTNWSWALINFDSTQIEMVEARNRKAVWRVDGSPSATWNMSGYSEAAYFVEELASDVLLRRDGELLQRSRVVAASDAIDSATSVHDMSLTATGYRGLLGLLARVDTDGVTFVQVDQGQIAWQLIEDYQNRTGADLSITEGVGSTSGQLRDDTYQPGASVGELIGNLGRRINGFEWDISPLLELDRYYPTRGNGNVGVLDLGGLVTKANYAVTAEQFGNVWIGTGAQELPAAEAVSADVATDPRGRWERYIGFPETSVASSLDDKLDWLLGETEAIKPEISLTLTADAWDGPDHIWIGDEVDLSIYSGRLEFEGTYRVVELAVSIDESDNETVDLGVIAL